MFKKATKTQSRLRMAIVGPSGSGKTYTALGLASVLGERVAVIDTERGSASKYADLFEFDVVELGSFHPQKYIEVIIAAAAEGYDTLVIDSLSHAWVGADGVLAQVDRVTSRSNSKNSFAAWKDVTPLQNQLVDTILSSPLHVIATMRAKSEYVMEQINQGGRTISVPRKVGVAPVQRSGIEYEFDVVADMDIHNTMTVTKTRCSALNGAIIERPDASLAETLKAWLTDGVPMPELPAQPQPQQPPRYGQAAQQPSALNRNQVIARAGELFKSNSAERVNTYDKMQAEGAFNACKSLDEAAKLLAARVKSHHEQPEAQLEDVEF